MDLSIIIVNYNTSALLSDCLRSIEEQTRDLEFEVIVVDNASSDDSREMVQSRHPTVKLLASQVNVGFGMANNLGAEIAKGKHLLFLNSDTVLLNNVPKILSSFLERNPDCGICGGNLTDTEGRPVHSYSKTLPTPWTDLYRFLPRLKPLIQGRDWCYNYSEEPKPVGYITGADLCMPAALFRKVGGFHKAFFMYYEETELTSRVRKEGFTVFSVPEARAVHIKGASLEFLPGNKEMVLVSKYRYLTMLYGAGGARLAHFLYLLYCLYKIVGNTVRRKRKSRDYYRKMYLLDKQVFRREVAS